MFLEPVGLFLGARRVAWGSNYPAAKGKLKDLRAQVRQALAPLTEEQRGWIFSGTAKDLYRIT